LSFSTSRGCLRRCSFCHESTHWKRYRNRAAESIVSEFKFNKNRFKDLEFIYFNDSIINGNIDELNRFCDIMASENMNVCWGGHIMIREEMSLSLLQKMKKAGADRLNYGVESGSDKVLRLMKKRCHSSLIREVLDNTRKAGISFSVNIVIGHPGETEEDFLQTVELVKHVRTLTPAIHLNPCLIINGSYLYKCYKELDLVLPQNDYQDKWYQKDGSNTYEIRQERLKRLEVIMREGTTC